MSCVMCSEKQIAVVAYSLANDIFKEYASIKDYPSILKGIKTKKNKEEFLYSRLYKVNATAYNERYNENIPTSPELTFEQAYSETGFDQAAQWLCSYSYQIESMSSDYEKELIEAIRQIDEKIPSDKKQGEWW